MSNIQLFVNKMQNEGLPQPVIDTFIHYYTQIMAGATGQIPESNIDQILPGELPDSEKMADYRDAGKKALHSAVILKLNGGLGTSMGLDGPKSIIPVKNDLCFLDIIALQIRFLNERFSSKLPLLLMNSFKTDKPSKKQIERYPDILTDLPLSFLQHKVPKVLASDLSPVSSPSDPSLEWNPPGHGDLYTSLVTSGLLAKLIDNGYRYAFVSNVDNLGAVLDLNILGYFAQNNFSFLMEVTDRTHMDRKGGHLARLKDGRLVLRESAQCLEKDKASFQDIKRHRYFNTNNLWVDLIALQELTERKQNVLDLPMIRNPRKLDPRDRNSADVYHLESAMGAAISVFENSAAVRVPRTRFAPVKTCEDLLLLWSDYYCLSRDFTIIRNPDSSDGKINVTLDPLYYARIDQLQERFPFGAPSLINCESLSVQGDVKFGSNIKIHGNVSIVNSSSSQASIEDNMLINGNVSF